MQSFRIDIYAWIPQPDVPNPVASLPGGLTAIIYSLFDRKLNVLVSWAGTQHLWDRMLTAVAHAMRTYQAAWCSRSACGGSTRLWLGR
jgi:hypothetical protein